MSWSEAKWVVDQLLQKTGQSPNNMRAFTAFAMSKTSIGLKFLEHVRGLLVVISVFKI